jgi:hypothetical protein
VYKINKINAIIITKLNIFIKLQYIDVSLAGHCMVVPNIPKIPEPMIPPLPEFSEFFAVDCLGI